VNLLIGWNGGGYREEYEIKTYDLEEVVNLWIVF